ncbi:MAG: hypothetical protein LBC29_07340 [Propionibacteriaceae bacterium]|jgi:hypothetical protein|nr:hypothetical protein [Propionibacteriaceae bacterium]
MRTVIAQLVTAMRDLGLRWGLVLRSSWRQVLALLLLGWVGIYGAELLAVLVINEYPWVVIPILAAGIVAELAAVVLALRLLIAAASDRQNTTGQFTNALATTLVPFFLVYAGFGMVDEFLREVLRLSQTLYGASLSSVLDVALDPFSSFWTLLIIVFAIFGVFALRELLSAKLGERPSLPLALVGGLISGALVLLVLLAGNQSLERIGIEISFQYHMREVYNWVQTLQGWLRNLLGETLLNVATGAIAWVRDTLAPLAWDVILQPLAWLALTTIVAGRDLVSAADYLALGVARRQGRKPVSWTNPVAIRIRDFTLDAFDDHVVTRVEAFRHVWRGGWPLVTAVVLSFGAIQFLTDLAERGLERWYAPYGLDAFVPYQPLVALVPKVLGLGLQLMLVAAAFTEADTVKPHTERLRIQLGAAALGIALSLGMAAAVGTVHRVPEYLPVNASADWSVAVGGATVQLEGVQVTRRISDETEGSSELAITELAFVLVALAITDYDASGDYLATIEVGGRTYLPYDTNSSEDVGYLSVAGLATHCTLVFEVDPAALRETFTLTFSPLKVTFTLPLPLGVFNFQLPEVANLDTAPVLTVPAVRLELP